MVDNKRKFIIISIFLTFQGGLFSQSTLNGIVDSTITPAGMDTLINEFTSQAVNISTIINSYNGGTLSYSQANSDFQNIMNQIYSSMGTDINQFLLNSKSSVDLALTSNFSDFIAAFGVYYGQAILLTSHLSYPVGYDRIDKSSGLILGFGGGTAFTNVSGIQSSLSGESATMFSSLNVLPTLALSLNGGIGISDRWSLRFSIFPTTSILLPTSSEQLQTFDISYIYGAYRARVSYLLVEDKRFGPGVSLSGFIGYNTGELSVKTNETSLTPIVSSVTSPANLTVQVTPSYNAEALCKWNDFTVGPEIRVWYNLGFIFPYIGYGIGFQSSEITTTFNFNTNILVNSNASAVLADGNTLTSTNSQTFNSGSKIENQSKGAYFLNRIILGTEIKIIMVRITGEVVFDPVNSLMGISFGASFAF